MEYEVYLSTLRGFAPPRDSKLKLQAAYQPEPTPLLLNACDNCNVPVCCHEHETFPQLYLTVGTHLSMLWLNVHASSCAVLSPGC
jgi:hypothetical protein